MTDCRNHLDISFPQSDNSYDYLSVEEKECLMFLEETIGSLDAEGDSGVSTDDTDSGEPSRARRGPVGRGELRTFLGVFLY